MPHAVSPTSPPPPSPDQSTLKKGEVLAAVRAVDNQGVGGFTIKGQFYPSPASATLQLGERVRIEVTEVLPSPTFRVLPESVPITPGPLQSLERAIGQLVDALQILRQLKDFEVLSELQALKTPLQATLSVFQSVTLDAILSHISEGEAPADLLKTLLALVAPERGTAETSFTAKDRLQFFSELAKLSPLLDVLSSDPEIASKIPALLEHMLSSAQLVDRDVASQHASRTSHAPLIKILEQLIQRWLDTLEHASTSDARQDTMTRLRSLMLDLQRGRFDGAFNPARGQDLQKSMQELLNALAPLVSRSILPTDVMRRLEAFASLKEGFSQISPLLRHVGEPFLILIPAFLSGTLSAWPVRWQDSHEHNDASKSGKRTERISSEISLPHLGRVAIQCALTGENALVSLHFESETRSQHSEAQEEHLLEALHSAGFQDAQIFYRADQENRGDVLPAWSTTRKMRRIV